MVTMQIKLNQTKHNLFFKNNLNLNKTVEKITASRTKID